MKKLIYILLMIALSACTDSIDFPDPYIPSDYDQGLIDDTDKIINEALNNISKPYEENKDKSSKEKFDESIMCSTLSYVRSEVLDCFMPVETGDRVVNGEIYNVFIYFTDYIEDKEITTFKAHFLIGKKNTKTDTYEIVKSYVDVYRHAKLDRRLRFTIFSSLSGSIAYAHDFDLMLEHGAIKDKFGLSFASDILVTSENIAVRDYILTENEKLKNYSRYRSKEMVTNIFPNAHFVLSAPLKNVIDYRTKQPVEKNINIEVKVENKQYTAKIFDDGGRKDGPEGCQIIGDLYVVGDKLILEGLGEVVDIDGELQLTILNKINFFDKHDKPYTLPQSSVLALSEIASTR